MVFFSGTKKKSLYLNSLYICGNFSPNKETLLFERQRNKKRIQKTGLKKSPWRSWSMWVWSNSLRVIDGIACPVHWRTIGQVTLAGCEMKTLTHPKCTKCTGIFPYPNESIKPIGSMGLVYFTYTCAIKINQM